MISKTSAACSKSKPSECCNKFLLYLSAFCLGLTFWRTPLYDPDLAFHLLGGAWLDKFAEVPRHDFINAFNVSWIDYHWFGQWLLYSAYKYLGWAGLQATTGVMLGLLALILLRLIEVSVRRSTPLFLLLYSSLLIWGLFGLFSARPTSIAKVVVALGLLVLVSKIRHKLAMIFILTVICANMHVYWVLLPALWAALVSFRRVFGGLLKRAEHRLPSSLSAWGGLLLLILAGSISPYGILTSQAGWQAKFTNYFVFLDVATNPQDLKPVIAELRNGFANITVFFWLALISLVIVARYYSYKRLLVRAPEVLVFAITFLMAVESIKYASLFLLGGIPFAAPAVFRVYRQLTRNKNLLYLQRPVLLFSLVVFAIFAITSWPFSVNNAKRAIADLRLMQPIDACRKLTEFLPADSQIIKVATIYDQGGWCAWGLNQKDFPSRYRVTMDGRTQSVPAQEILDGLAMYRGANGWDLTLQKLDPDAVVVEKGEALAQLLRERPGWRLAYADRSFGVFVKQRAR